MKMAFSKMYRYAAQKKVKEKMQKFYETKCICTYFRRFKEAVAIAKEENRKMRAFAGTIWQIMQKRVREILGTMAEAVPLWIVQELAENKKQRAFAGLFEYARKKQERHKQMLKARIFHNQKRAKAVFSLLFYHLMLKKQMRCLYSQIVEEKEINMKQRVFNVMLEKFRNGQRRNKVAKSHYKSTLKQRILCRFKASCNAHRDLINARCEAIKKASRKRKLWNILRILYTLSQLNKEQNYALTRLKVIHNRRNVRIGLKRWRKQMLRTVWEERRISQNMELKRKVLGLLWEYTKARVVEIKEYSNSVLKKKTLSGLQYVCYSRKLKVFPYQYSNLSQKVQTISAVAHRSSKCAKAFFYQLRKIHKLSQISQLVYSKHQLNLLQETFLGWKYRAKVAQWNRSALTTFQILKEQKVKRAILCQLKRASSLSNRLSELKKLAEKCTNTFRTPVVQKKYKRVQDTEERMHEGAAALWKIQLLLKSFQRWHGLFDVFPLKEEQTNFRGKRRDIVSFCWKLT
eukprot:TRINITY_DN88342_c1_g1_i1.p1 TRINITY_DN88342_c1_g1~~TRINITY_DN88342_c1_g1_i1.p1  ORF type:complete len:516 (-),score=48.28 TRINITY_DN88342_c1_g1_i1:2412-3959(-)